MKIFDLLKALVTPASVFFRSVVAIVSLALGAIADPTGALNALVVRLIDFIALFWPSTPEQLKIANLIFPQSGAVPIGQYIIIELFSTAFLMISIVAFVKLYKLIPFKGT